MRSMDFSLTEPVFKKYLINNNLLTSNSTNLKKYHQQFLPKFQADLSHSYYSSFTTPHPCPQLHSYPCSPNVDVNHSNYSNFITKFTSRY